MNLIATQNGKAAPLDAVQKSFQWAGSALPTKATGTAESRLGKLTFKVTGEAEYTGHYLVNMDIVPDAGTMYLGSATLDRLELEIPVSDPVDTAFAYIRATACCFTTRITPGRAFRKKASCGTTFGHHVLLVGGPRGRTSCTSATAIAAFTGTPIPTKDSGLIATSRVSSSKNGSMPPSCAWPSSTSRS